MLLKFKHLHAAILILVLNLGPSLRAYDFFQLPEEEPGYVGSLTCQTSMCHGGADTLHRQFTIWKTQDPHSKSYATLTTAWSKRMGEALGIKDVTVAPQCLACHAPLALVPEPRRSPAVRIEEGVSCESCHGPASGWLLSHTRLDYSYAQRLAGGMKDLRNLYVRAATCVACHQNLDPKIRLAGHPELKFDFTGLQEREPRHWVEEASLVQQWLVGQATALREMAYVINLWKGEQDTGSMEEEAQARRFLLADICGFLRGEPGLYGLTADFPETDWETLSRSADRAARDLSQLPWSQKLETLVRSQHRKLLGAGRIPVPDTISERIRAQLTTFPAGPEE